MNTSELRGKSRAELEETLRELRSELQTMRLTHRVGGLSDVSSLQKKKKDVAQVMTVLREKEIIAV